MESSSPAEITYLLERAHAGDGDAGDRLMAAVYDELHRRAASLMRGQGEGHTLQASALVHEAYMKLVGARQEPFVNRRHFLSVAATAMRQVLIDHARRKESGKRQAPGEQEPLDSLVVEYASRAIDLEALDVALNELAGFDAEMARAVELRFFADLSVAETAEELGLAPRTLERRWRATRAWLLTRVR
ncbi:MAG: ECF-type sigma factor [Planctomycetota bacterium]